MWFFVLVLGGLIGEEVVCDDEEDDETAHARAV